jgi:hypothetical protein
VAEVAQLKLRVQTARVQPVCYTAVTAAPEQME